MNKRFLPIFALLVFLVAMACSSSTPKDTPVPAPTKEPTAPPAAAQVKSYIAEVTLAEDTQGEEKVPINPTSTFGPNSIFHAVVRIEEAPADSTYTATWYAVNVAGGVKPNTKIDSTDLTTEGSRNIDFTLSPTKDWPVGTYKVDISFNKQIAKTIQFSVKEGVTSSPAKPTQPAAAASGDNYIEDLVLCKDVVADTFEPVDPTTTFSTDSVIHLVVKIKDAPANTSYETIWTAVDVGDAAAANTKIDSTSLSAEGTRNLHFKLSPAQSWPAGTYKVEVLVNGASAQTAFYDVE